jgi:putative modified peptide
MAGTTNLTQDQARALLEKLARDDSFRASFAAAPAQALEALGLDANTIAQLPAACLSSTGLAPKDHYDDLLKNSSAEAISNTMSMSVPQIGIRKR